MKTISTLTLALALIFAVTAFSKSNAETKELSVKNGTVTIPVKDLENSRMSFFKTTTDGKETKYYLVTNTDNDTFTAPCGRSFDNNSNVGNCGPRGPHDGYCGPRGGHGKNFDRQAPCGGNGPRGGCWGR